jgi:hypothetical protein
MCYDNEKTQAPFNPRVREAMDSERKSRFADMQTAGCDRPLGDSEVLAELFKYHPPNAETLPKYAAINQAAKNFAEIVLQNCPRSADRSAAIRLIRDARMTANASVALNGLSL